MFITHIKSVLNQSRHYDRRRIQISIFRTIKNNNFCIDDGFRAHEDQEQRIDIERIMIEIYHSMHIPLIFE